MTGFEVGTSTQPGEEGLEFARVVGVETKSPPSPSLSIAESSTSRYFLLLESTTKMRVLESSEKKRKEREKKNSLVFVEQLDQNVHAKRKKDGK